MKKLTSGLLMLSLFVYLGMAPQNYTKKDQKTALCILFPIPCASKHAAKGLNKLDKEIRQRWENNTARQNRRARKFDSLKLAPNIGFGR